MSEPTRIQRDCEDWGDKRKGGLLFFPQYLVRSYVEALGFILGIFQLFIPELSCSVYFIEHNLKRGEYLKTLTYFKIRGVNRLVRQPAFPPFMDGMGEINIFLLLRWLQE